MKTAKLSPSTVELSGPWSHEYLHTRGIRLHVAVAGDPKNPLILCIHGAMGGWFDYKEMLEPLAAAGFHVAALDLRGYGLSDKPPVELGQDIRTLIGDVTGAIQALGHNQAIVMANDTGAGLAWVTACERPQHVLGLISISGAHPVDLRRAIAARPWDFGWFIARSILSRLPIPLLRSFSLPFLVSTDARLNTLTSFPGSPAGTAAVQLRQTAINIDKSFRATIWNHRLLTAPLPLNSVTSATSSPVLFIHAKQGLWGPVIRRASHRARQVTAATIPGTKNLPHLENPQGLAQTIIKWAKDVHGEPFS